MPRPFHALLSLSLLFAACSPTLHEAAEPHVQLIATAYDPSEIRAALIRALDKRKFTPEKEEGGKITARFEKGGRYALVQIDYSQTQFDIRYLDSSGLSETKDPATGVLMVDSHYTDLVNGLDKSIREELLRPAKEAAAAERHKEQYEAMLQAGRVAEANANAQAAQAAEGQADADANAAQANENQAQADAQTAQANADAAQANANAPAPTIINNNRTIIIRNAPAGHPAGAWPSFCDKPVKAIWSCPTPQALSACEAKRGNCSAVCKVGGGC